MFYNFSLFDEKVIIIFIFYQNICDTEVSIHISIDNIQPYSFNFFELRISCLNI